MPGYAKRYSTITTPPASQAAVRAKACSEGPIAFGSTWCLITLRSGMPLSRAMATYSDDSTSITPARTMRAVYASESISSVATGQHEALGA